MRAIRVEAFGPPETLAIQDLPDPVPGPGELLVRVAYAGVNFYDTQARSGLFKRALPIALGSEGAGTVAALGPQTAAFKTGDRVTWAQGAGSYATHAIVSAKQAVPLPPEVELSQAAAVLFQGLTAHHLACSTYPLQPGDVAVVHSAAGGVGGLLTQIAKLRGATVVGIVSTEAKAEAARRSGADVVLRYEQDVKAEIERFTGGARASVVYDAVGTATFELSLSVLRPRGYMIIYGEASGFIPPFDLRRLSALGSIYVTRTSLSNYLVTREELLGRATDLFGWLASGKLKTAIHATYPLAEAGAAQAALESRGTIGKVLLDCAEC